MLARCRCCPGDGLDVLGIGGDVITTSAPLVASAIDRPAVAPRSVQAFTALALRSNTVT